MLNTSFCHQEMKSQGIEENRLQLLRDVSGAFRPSILTTLVGVSGAGKTTLMDVLAERKTGGYIEGSISISGYPKNQATFARVSGYCEQNDIHSPHVTVYESLLYSAWLRLAKDVDKEIQKARFFLQNLISLSLNMPFLYELIFYLDKLTYPKKLDNMFWVVVMIYLVKSPLISKP
jgi:ABC-type cobalamin/Fe3+-siderophores transport system ATPase subunit